MEAAHFPQDCLPRTGTCSLRSQAESFPTHLLENLKLEKLPGTFMTNRPS